VSSFGLTKHDSIHIGNTRQTHVANKSFERYELKITHYKISKKMKNFLISLFLISTLILFSPLVHSRLKTMGAVETITIEGEEQKRFQATCSTTKLRPVIARKASEQLWCHSMIKDLCGKDRFKVAQRACSKSNIEALSSQSSEINNPIMSGEIKNRDDITKREMISKLKQEAFDIERRLIEVREAQVKLRKRQLELMRAQGL